MNKRGFRRVAVFASAAVLTGGAVAGCGSSAATTNGTGTGSTQQQGQPPQGGGMDVTALADALGVSATKLQAAMQKVMPQPGQQPANGSPGDMAATLAKELGLTESKVSAALEKLRPQGAPPAAGNGQAAPSVTPSNSTTS